MQDGYVCHQARGLGIRVSADQADALRAFLGGFADVDVDDVLAEAAEVDACGGAETVHSVYGGGVVMDGATLGLRRTQVLLERRADGWYATHVESTVRYVPDDGDAPGKTVVTRH